MEDRPYVVDFCIGDERLKLNTTSVLYLLLWDFAYEVQARVVCCMAFLIHYQIYRDDQYPLLRLDVKCFPAPEIDVICTIELYSRKVSTD